MNSRKSPAKHRKIQLCTHTCISCHWHTLHCWCNPTLISWYKIFTFHPRLNMDFPLWPKATVWRMQTLSSFRVFPIAFLLPSAHTSSQLCNALETCLLLHVTSWISSGSKTSHSPYCLTSTCNQQMNPDPQERPSWKTSVDGFFSEVMACTSVQSISLGVCVD